jgi:hypothetical protein
MVLAGKAQCTSTLAERHSQLKDMLSHVVSMARRVQHMSSQHSM